MNLSRFVFDATSATFDELVLGNSARGPVLVHFWSAGAGPCMVLMPRIVRLATEYAGRFLAVMVDTGTQGRLARDYAVSSVPTLKLFVGGRPVETVHGVQTEVELRELLGRHLARESDLRHAEAIGAYEAGDHDRAFDILEQAELFDPGNLRLFVDHAKLLLRSGRLEQAEQVLGGLPDEVQERGEIVQLRAHVGFLLAASDAPPEPELERAIGADPDDLESRFRLAARRLAEDDVEAAMDQLIEIVRRDHDYRADAARRGLVTVFAMLGNAGELVERYRSQLKDAIRSHDRPGGR